MSQLNPARQIAVSAWTASMRKLMAWLRSRRPTRRQPFYQADRAEIDRAMREGGRITGGHMTGKMQNQGSKV